MPPQATARKVSYLQRGNDRQFFLMSPPKKAKTIHESSTHMNDQLDGYFADDGPPLIPNLLAKPSLCVMCKHDEAPKQEILCNLTRLDQQDEDAFCCAGFEEIV